MKKRILSIAICFCMVLSVVSVWKPVTVQALEQAKVTELVSSEIDSQTIPKWTAKMDEDTNKLTISMTDENADSNWNVYFYVGGSEMSDLKDYKVFSGDNCTVTGDCSKLKDGINSVLANVRKENTVQWQVNFYLEVVDGQASIYSPYGQAAIDVQNELNKNYKPEDYIKPTIPALKLDNYEEIVAKAKEIVENAVTDADKIKAIHDWICKNVAYDCETINKGQNVTKRMPGNAGFVFENKLAVCAGFSSLAEVMYHAVGIPCVSITGKVNTLEVFLDDAKEYELSHEWNAVYYDGAWRYMDLTWDCLNSYYGLGSTNNKSGKDPRYKYFGMQAELMGAGHYNNISGVIPVNTALGITVTNQKTTYKVGDTFDKNYMLNFKGRYKVQVGFTDEYTDIIEAGEGLGEATGYDLNKAGTQTVTVSYRGFETTYDIEVVDVCGIKAVPDATKTYIRGDSFIPSYKLYYVLTDGSEELLTNMDGANCSGYDTTKAGTQTVAVEYKGYQTTFDIDVVDTTGITVVPNETREYKYGSTFVPDFKLYLNYSNGSREIVDGGETVATCTGYNMSKTGEQTVSVSYKGFQTTYAIRVVTEKKGIRVEPAVTSYTYGDSLNKKHTIYYVMSDGTEQIITNPDAIYYGYSMTKTGKQTVTVSCDGFKTTYTITVAKKAAATTTEKPTTTKKPTTKITTISKRSVILYRKKSTSLSVANATSKVTWSSSNKKVAKVSSTGKVTALKKGSAIIYAKFGKTTLKCSVTVKNPYLVFTHGSVQKGYTLSSIKIKGGAGKVSYKSMNKKIATVSSKGKVKGKKKGNVKIKVKVSGITLIYKVTVYVPSVTTKNEEEL